MSAATGTDRLIRTRVGIEGVRVIRWSPFPREQYTVEIDGVRQGVGVHPAFTTAGVWNLFWLSTRLVDQILVWNKPPEQAPYDSSMIPICVGMAWQPVTLASRLAGPLAEEVAPGDFLQLIKADPFRDEFLLPRIFGDDWWKFAEARAAEYRPEMATRVLWVDFGKGRIQ